MNISAEKFIVGKENFFNSKLNLIYLLNSLKFQNSLLRHHLNLHGRYAAVIPLAKSLNISIIIFYQFCYNIINKRCDFSETFNADNEHPVVVSGKRVSCPLVHVCLLYFFYFVVKNVKRPFSNALEQNEGKRSVENTILKNFNWNLRFLLLY